MLKKIYILLFLKWHKIFKAYEIQNPREGTMLGKINRQKDQYFHDPGSKAVATSPAAPGNVDSPEQIREQGGNFSKRQVQTQAISQQEAAAGETLTPP